MAAGARAVNLEATAGTLALARLATRSDPLLQWSPNVRAENRAMCALRAAQEWSTPPDFRRAHFVITTTSLLKVRQRFAELQQIVIYWRGHPRRRALNFAWNRLSVFGVGSSYGPSRAPGLDYATSTVPASMHARPLQRYLDVLSVGRHDLRADSALTPRFRRAIAPAPLPARLQAHNGNPRRLAREPAHEVLL
jgi:hypothetical protein